MTKIIIYSKMPPCVDLKNGEMFDITPTQLSQIKEIVEGKKVGNCVYGEDLSVCSIKCDHQWLESSYTCLRCGKSRITTTVKKEDWPEELSRDGYIGHGEMVGMLNFLLRRVREMELKIK